METRRFVRAVLPRAVQCLDSEQGKCVFLVSGLEYELLLSQELTSAGVPFWTEADLRLQGLHKTPDARLKAGGFPRMLSNMITPDDT